MQGHVVLEGLGGARTLLFAYNTMHGTFLKHLPAQASNDGITFHNASHPTHGVSLRSLRPRRQTPAPAPLTVSWRICLDWMPAVVLPGNPVDLQEEATVFISCTKRSNDRTLLEEDRVQSAPLGAMRRWEEQTL